MSDIEQLAKNLAKGPDRLISEVLLKYTRGIVGGIHELHEEMSKLRAERDLARAVATAEPTATASAGEVPSAVPDARIVVPLSDDSTFTEDMRYAQGWNDCRAAMLSAIPSPSDAQGDVPDPRDKHRLLGACIAAYRKHHLGDDSIGWDELSQCLGDALANAIGTDDAVADAIAAQRGGSSDAE